MFKAIGKGIGVGLLGLTVCTTATIVAALIVYQLVADTMIEQNIRCHLGLSDECIRLELDRKKRELKDSESRVAAAGARITVLEDELVVRQIELIEREQALVALAEQEAQRRELLLQREDELAALQVEAGKMKTLLERLRALDHASESYAVFYTASYKDWVVTTGIGYESLFNPDRMNSGWCYTEDYRSGVTKKITFGAFDQSFDLVFGTPSDAELRAYGISREDFLNAALRCHWPDVVVGKGY